MDAEQEQQQQEEVRRRRDGEPQSLAGREVVGMLGRCLCGLALFEMVQSILWPCICTWHLQHHLCLLLLPRKEGLPLFPRQPICGRFDTAGYHHQHLNRYANHGLKSLSTSQRSMSSMMANSSATGSLSRNSTAHSAQRRAQASGVQIGEEYGVSKRSLLVTCMENGSQRGGLRPMILLQVRKASLLFWHVYMYMSI